MLTYIAESILRVVKGMDKLGIAFQSPISRDDHVQSVKSLCVGKTKYYTLPPEIVNAIESLWVDGGFQECFRRAYEYQLNDSAPYYFENLSRLLVPGYVPTEQDVLRSRVATTSVVETAFRVGKLTYRLVDVGGQRTERRKWIQCFDDIRAVLFVSALNEYDMTLFEEERVNRLDESLNLFQTICNNKYFVRTTMILFLNKMDLFRDKILNSDRHLKLFFTQYTGPDQEVEAAAHFILHLFLERNLNKGRVIYPHFTTATDTSNIKVVLKVVLDAIVRENLEVKHLL